MQVTSPWLAPATLRNLSDKLYEKRKAAALEVEQARSHRPAPHGRRAVAHMRLAFGSQATKALAAAGDLISVVRGALQPRAVRGWR